MKINFCKKIIFVLITTLIFSMSCFCLPSDAQNTVRGVWVGTVGNLDFPSSQKLSEKALKTEIGNIVSTCKSVGINTIFFQVRPNADALYKSSVFPWSSVLSGEQGKAPDNNFDPLKYFIDACHKNKIQLHAWINPYRVCKADMLDTLCDTNPAKAHPEYTVNCSDGYIYFNPALNEVRELVKSGVEEILKNYDVDGIHFDDYFYPYNVIDYPDADDYKKFGSDFENIDDFRRNNVNTLVKEVNSLVDKYKSTFGISPFGIWDNLSANPDGSETNGLSSYRSIFADSRAWVKNGWVDYICPQIYWSTTDADAPFEPLVKWWNDLCSGTKVDLYIGHALYKLGEDYQGFDSLDEIKTQLDICANYKNVNGSVFFRYSNIANNTLNCAEAIGEKSAFTHINTTAVKGTELKITSIQNNHTTSAANCSVSGIANPDYPLTVNGKTVKLTQNGYFCEYVSLDLGENNFNFINGEQSKNITIIRKNATPQQFDGVFYPDSAFPVGECTFSPLQAITVSIDAIDGIEVHAVIAGKDTVLEKTNVSGNRATYTTQISFPNTLYNSINFGEISYYAIKDNNRADHENKAKITITDIAKTLYVKNECYVYDSVFGGSMMDNFQLSQGSIVVATSFANDQYKLLSGKWISKDDVSESPISTKPDINKSKYQKITICSQNVFENYCSVNEEGTLLVNVYGASTPEIKNENDTVCRVVSSDNVTTVAVSDVFGYFAHRKDENTLDIYVYKASKTLDGKTVVIDVGHGGKDSGALGPAGADGPSEAILNLSVSQLLANKLSKAGAKVVLTRTGDSTLLLKDRAELIRSHNPDICISIHHNSMSVESDFNKSTGALVLYSRENALKLANIISDDITNDIKLNNQGVKKQSLNVCREYRFPSVLIECGFVCNPSEYELMLTDGYKQTLTDNIVSSICDYFNKNS